MTGVTLTAAGRRRRPGHLPARHRFGLIERYWSAGTAPVFEIIAQDDPFLPEGQ
jgi:hypothetical protein